MSRPDDTQTTADEFAHAMATQQYATIHDLMASPAIVERVVAERARTDAAAELPDERASLPARS